MYKVFKTTGMSPEDFIQKYHSEDIEGGKETIQYSGQYTNYEDSFMELPNLEDTAPEIAKELIKDYAEGNKDWYPVVVTYVADNPEDSVKALKVINDVYYHGSANYNGKEYDIYTTEWSGEAIAVPAHLHQETVAELAQSLEEDEKEMVNTYFINGDEDALEDLSAFREFILKETL